MSAATDYFFAELRKHLRCAICGRKVVDAVERRWDLITCTETAIVRCHSDVEVVTVPSELIEDLAYSGRLSLGMAFDRKGLPAVSP